jgi:hypothetical protein
VEVRSDVARRLRNATEHGADPDTQRMIRLAKSERAIRRLYRAIDDLPPHERFPFGDPMILATTVSTQERWVSDTETYLPKAFKRIKRQGKMHNHSLEEHGFYGTKRIGKLVGFFSLHVFSQFPLESCRSSQAHPFSFMLLSFHKPGTA